MNEGLITFNVGGTLFTTNASTLLSYKDSLLGVMVSSCRVGDKPIFIDRNPNLFGYILDCHRNRTIYTSEEIGVGKRRWTNELAYFQLVNPAIPKAIEEPTKVENPKKRTAKDIVKEIEQDKKAKVDAVASTFEPIILWMLSKRPKQFFVFMKHPAGLKRPEGLPQEIFDMDVEFVWEHRSEFEKLCNADNMHVRMEKHTALRTGTEPAALYYPDINIPNFVRDTGISIHLRLFGEL